MTLTLSSPAFKDNSEIPEIYTCDSANISPALYWRGIPAEAKSLALIVDDPDAPQTTWAHWILYNMPPSTSGIEEGINTNKLPSGTLPGLNSWKRANYGGPCPPSGQHRYVFKLYALDVVLPDLKLPTKANVEIAMKGHIIEETKLIGTYRH